MLAELVEGEWLEAHLGEPDLRILDATVQIDPAVGIRSGRPDWESAYVAGAPRVPGFVWAITVTQLLLFTAFAVNMGLQYARIGRWQSYVFGEAGYMVLSVTAKSLLAWLIFANVLRT